jgi:hypothetical protein
LLRFNGNGKSFKYNSEQTIGITLNQRTNDSILEAARQRLPSPPSHQENDSYRTLIELLQAEEPFLPAPKEEFVPYDRAVYALAAEEVVGNGRFGIERGQLRLQIDKDDLENKLLRRKMDCVIDMVLDHIIRSGQHLSQGKGEEHTTYL